jgi:hypothetical protein
METLTRFVRAQIRSLSFTNNTATVVTITTTAKQQRSSTQLHAAFKFLYVLTKVRGHKAIGKPNRLQTET